MQVDKVNDELDRVEPATDQPGQQLVGDVGHRAHFLLLDIEAELDQIVSPINVTAMRDVDDADDYPLIENLIDHPEFAPPGRVPPLQLIAKWLADPIRIRRERTSNEFPTRNG